MSEVRALIGKALGMWVLHYPAKFLTQNSFKWLGCLLRDRDGDVRLAVIELLARLYAAEDVADELGPYVAALIPRIVEMSCDVDARVAVAGVRLLTTLVQHDMLQNEDKDKISKLLWCSLPEMRYAAVFFVDLGILNDSLVHNEDFEKHESLMLSLLSFIDKTIDNDLNKIPFVVEAYWEKTNVIIDYSLMCELLLRGEEGENVNKVSLPTSQRLILLHILSSSVQLAKSSLEELNKKSKKKTQESENLKKIVDSCASILFTYLPKILNVYETEIDFLKELTKMPQFFEIEVLSSSDLKTQFIELLDVFKSIYKKITDKTVLAEISKCLL